MSKRSRKRRARKSHAANHGFPISATVKFAGDTAILILDDVRAGPGGANWSARVMFHDDVYAGRWWETSNKEHGGTIAGTITREARKAP